MSELCRICAKLANPTNGEQLFERSHRKILRQIEELIGQRLKNTKQLPQLICETCQERTLEAHLFRECCIQTQKHFASASYQNKSNDHQRPKSAKRKHKSLDERIPRIEEVVLEGINTVKAEEALEEDDAEVMPNETEDVLLKHEPLIDTDEPTIDNDGCSPVVIDYHDTNAAPMLASKIVEVQLKPHCKTDKTSDEDPFSSDDSTKYKPTINRLDRPRRTYEIHHCGETKNPKNKKPKMVGEKPDYICDQCGTHFNNFTIFTTHLRRHAGEKPFQCEICPEKFLSQAQLLRHIRKHTGEKPYPCRYCERRFLDSSARVRHERVHNNERPFVCQQCGKSFTVSYTLKEHMRIHTGERAFSCKTCNVSFTLKAHLVTHYRSMTHKQNDEKYQNLQNQTNAETGESSNSNWHND